MSLIGEIRSSSGTDESWMLKHLKIVVESMVNEECKEVFEAGNWSHLAERMLDT